MAQFVQSGGIALREFNLTREHVGGRNSCSIYSPSILVGDAAAQRGRIWIINPRKYEKEQNSREPK